MQGSRHKFLGVICFVLWLLILIFGLSPFNFHPTNRVTWLEGRNGIHFDRYGEAYSTVPLIPTVAATRHGYTVELWLHSSEERYHSVSGILSIDDPTKSADFAIAQSSRDLLVRGQVLDQNNHITDRKLYIDLAFQGPQTRLVTVTSGAEGTTLYLDGISGGRYPVTLALSNFSGQLLLGHTSVGHQDWTGDLLGIALYERTLTASEVFEDYKTWRESRTAELTKREGIVGLYPFDERTGDVIHNRAGSAPDIIIPRQFRILHRTILSFASDLTRSNLDLRDIFINITGFVPFGFCLCTFLRSQQITKGKAIVLTVIIGGITSLTIELLQVYLPSRDSSLVDVIDNIIGTMLGSVLPVWWLRLVPK